MIFLFLNIVMLMILAVEVGKRINGESLEDALMGVATDMSLTPVSVDRYEKAKSVFASDSKKKYTETMIILKDGSFTVAEISGLVRGEQKDWFFMSNGFNTSYSFFGFGSKEKITDYLKAVSKKISLAGWYIVNGNKL